MSIHIKLPKNLPNVEVNSENFEVGFDEDLIVGDHSKNAAICSICQALPRHPASLPGCGHLFCDTCLKKYIDERDQGHSFGNLIPCPICRHKFHPYGAMTFGYFQFWSQNLYRSIHLKCPYGCGFESDAMEVDKHQVFTCPKRRIKCPNEGCQIMMKACDMEERHLKDCPQQLMFCSTCFLPVKSSELTSHHCIQKLSEALVGMIFEIHNILLLIEKHDFF